ncbi:MAG TPA: hypothetical protein VE244_07830 [Nitrososphaeraceae archaeon]|nr:hypothetical protein [Nitrososphaeraceae archaeon]
MSSHLQYIIGKHLLPPRTDGEQHKDNNNNIINYAEFNTDSILLLDLSERITSTL